MKLSTAGFCAALAVSGSVAGAMAVPIAPSVTKLRSDPVGVAAADNQDLSRFVDGQTLLVEGRLGHGSIAMGSSGETFLFAQVTGNDLVQAAPPLNLAVAIDRSDSMKGDRITNAIAAATGIVERMRDGDSISVISFDTVADTVVVPTIINTQSRASIESRIRSIRLGGDTCISCGLERAIDEIDRSSLPRERVSRIMLLSDGATNHGIVDMPGMRSLAGRIRDRGTAVSTIGVDVDFDEKMMAAIANESNGRHYFVSNPSGLSSIFEQEFDSLLASVARDGEMRVDLADGVEVEQVFDRSFHREGKSIVVPFGTFSAKQQKTILLKLRVPSDHQGSTPVAKLRLDYRDLARQSAGHCGGELAVRVVTDGTASELDPFVAARVERSRTAQTLTEANVLFEQGHVEAAREKLALQTNELSASHSAAKRAAPMTPTPVAAIASLDDDFENQAAAIRKSEITFAKPPTPMATTSGGGFANGGPAAAAPTRRDRAQVKDNQQTAADLAE